MHWFQGFDHRPRPQDLLSRIGIFGVRDNNPQAFALASYRKIRVKWKLVIGEEQLKPDRNLIVRFFSHWVEQTNATMQILKTAGHTSWEVSPDLPGSGSIRQRNSAILR